MRCKRSKNEGNYRRKENSVLVTDKKKVAEIFNNYFSFQNLGEEHNSDPYVAVDISVHPSIAAMETNVWWLLSLSLITSKWPKLS